MNITAVIPTRNRIPQLETALNSLLSQSRQPDEIIVVDSSDNKELLNELKLRMRHSKIRWIDSAVSVCIQRNSGIERASGDWIFLCDDDIEVAPGHLEVLEKYVAETPGCHVVCGRLLQLEQGEWVDRYPVRSFGELLWRFVFQLPIWGDVDGAKAPFFLRPLYALLKKFYAMKGNTLTLAGWPLITQWNADVFQTRVYSLGASLINREWLLRSRYDEVLDQHGIGDNYGVALNFPGNRPIHVLNSTYAYHHREKANRIDQPVTYYRRILSLHYFLKRCNKFSALTAAAFVWSLIGNAISFYLTGNRHLSRVTLKAVRLILFGKNPYYAGFLTGKKLIQPVCYGEGEDA